VNILIIEPYYTGSHASWADGYRDNSCHNVEILSLPGRNWKWRMRGGAVTLSRRFLEQGLVPDLILATDMLDLSTFASLTRQVSAAIPTAIYFHENQFTYPWHPNDRERVRGTDSHYGFINFLSALSAERVFFNSAYHLNSFLEGLQVFLERFPEFDTPFHIDAIREKSSVLYVGMDFKVFDGAEAAAPVLNKTLKRPPLLLWNHRWEHDKNPEEFFRALYTLMDSGLEFEVVILGESFNKSSASFLEARERLGERILHFGYAKDFAEYAAWLRRADILPVTSTHDFFGCSVVEAIYSGCLPILPRDLAYPEHLSPQVGGTDSLGAVLEKCFYEGFNDLLRRLEWAITNIEEVRRTSFKSFVSRYAWDNMAPLYDREMEKIMRRALTKKRARREPSL